MESTFGQSKNIFIITRKKCTRTLSVYGLIFNWSFKGR